MRIFVILLPILIYPCLLPLMLMHNYWQESDESQNEYAYIAKYIFVFPIAHTYRQQKISA